MTKASKASVFLENMQQQAPLPAEELPTARAKKAQGRAPSARRDGLKHIGGYCDPETVEKFAILRARLNLDNSELITLAIDELYSKQKAKRAFND